MARTPDRAGCFSDGKLFIKHLLRVCLSLGCQMASETSRARASPTFFNIKKTDEPCRVDRQQESYPHLISVINVSKK
jgi:hypothetical protein